MREYWRGYRESLLISGAIEEFSASNTYKTAYEDAAGQFEKAATKLKDGDNQAAAEKFDKALNKILARVDEWKATDKEKFETDLKIERPTSNLITDIVDTYTESIEALANVTTIRTPMLSLTASPVNTTVTDPEGRTVGPNRSEIPNSSYSELQLEGTDSTEELIFIQDQIPGLYHVEVEPESDAEPTDTYTVAVRSDEQSTQIAADEQIQDIPSDGYSVSEPSTSTDNQLPTEPGEPSFRDVLGVIKAYQAGSQYNGVEVSFQDVLQVIQAYNEGRDQ
ncbi:hypothetical protein [Haloplanus rubicundus]|uniref:hypothetical protein n=1 Tax=Haloplanus rubicundus TaxID=1547898 RepID=UPI001300B054|nr:hypothetical protein [Haloplanus rubicundus]